MIDTTTDPNAGDQVDPTDTGSSGDQSWDSLIRPAALAPHLTTVTGDDRWRNLTVRLLTGGKSNLTFSLSSPAGELVLRRPPTGDLLPSAHNMSREVRIQRALTPTNVPVARILTESQDAELIGAPFYIMEKVDGHVIRGALPPGYATSTAERVDLAHTLIDTLADLHSVDADAVGLADYGRPQGFLTRQLKRWYDQWAASRTHEVAAIDELAARLSEHIPAESRRSLVHGDFRLDNCLMALHNPGKIAAVLDWELSTLGDPLTDLGLMMFFWRERGEAFTVITPGVTSLDGFPTRAELIERYAKKSEAAVSSLSFYEALAHLKFAVVVQGISARVASGAMAGQDFGDLDAEVARIARDGLDIARSL